jgi:carbon monoxide dehydrogenase subunit G
MERSVLINASPETIDAFALDVRGWPNWYPGVEHAEPDANYPNVGSVVKVVYKAAGMNFNMTFTVSDYEYLNTVAYDIDGMMTGMTRYTLTPQGNGTLVTGQFEYEVPGGGLGKMLDKLLLERMNSQNLEASLNNMKAAIEG